jgi:hypothetical protein
VNKVLLEKTIIAHLFKKFSALYGTRRFIAVFIRADIDPYPSSAETNPHPPVLFLLDPFGYHPIIYQ